MLYENTRTIHQEHCPGFSASGADRLRRPGHGGAHAPDDCGAAWLAAPGRVLGWPGFVPDDARGHGGAIGHLCRLSAQCVAGAFTAAAAFILPAFVLMSALSFLYFTYTDISWVQAVSRGMGAVVIALLLQALWRLGQAVRQHWLDAVIALLSPWRPWLRVNFLLVFLAAGLLRMALGLWLLPGHNSPKPAVTTAPNRALGLTLVLAALVLLRGWPGSLGFGAAATRSGPDGPDLPQGRGGKLRGRLRHDPDFAMGSGEFVYTGSPSSNFWTASSWASSPRARLSSWPRSWATGCTAFSGRQWPRWPYSCRRS